MTSVFNDPIKSGLETGVTSTDTRADVVLCRTVELSAGGKSKDVGFPGDARILNTSVIVTRAVSGAAQARVFYGTSTDQNKYAISVGVSAVGIYTGMTGVSGAAWANPGGSDFTMRIDSSASAGVGIDYELRANIFYSRN